MSSNAQCADVNAQEPQPYNIVVDFKSREQWKRAFDAVALQRKYRPRACVLMSRLADHFNCKTGQCNPGFDVLAEEMGASDRTVRRAVDDIEPDGWFLTKLGGRNKVSFTLCIPDLIPDTIVSAIDDGNTGHNGVRNADDQSRTHSASIPDTMVSAHKEQTNRQEEGGPSARPYAVPVESLVVEPVTMRAPEGAQANPVEREEPMLTPEQKDAVAELLQYKWTPRELADAAGCPDDVPIMLWLAQHGLAEQTPNGWKFRKNLN
jgi:hypothetical protein